MLARLYFHDREPDDDTLAAAIWLHGDLMENVSNAVCNGIAKAFSKK